MKFNIKVLIGCLSSAFLPTILNLLLLSKLGTTGTVAVIYQIITVLFVGLALGLGFSVEDDNQSKVVKK